MSQQEWTRWIREESGIAALFSAGGLLRRQEEVPAGARLMKLPDGDEWLESGTLVEGEGLLVRSEPLLLTLQLLQLADVDGVEGTLALTLEIDPPRQRVAALSLRDLAFAERERYGANDLAPALVERVITSARAILRERSWDGDDGALRRFEQGAEVTAALQPYLFERGLELLRVRKAEVVSEEVAERRRRASELHRESLRIQDQLEFFELWKKEELGEVLAREEVEKVTEHLQRQGMVRRSETRRRQLEEMRERESESARARGQLQRMLERERIAAQIDIDAERLEYEVERARKLEESLSKHGLLGAVMGVGDEEARSRLTELLIEREMTPEQIAARQQARAADEKLGSDLEARFARFADELRRELGSAISASSVQRLPRARRIWVAAGLALYRGDADAAFSGTDLTPVLPPEELGYLRSVRVAEQDGEPLILVGAQLGVATYRPRGSHWTIFAYAQNARGRGGANSVELVGDHLFATHSELGLQFWNVRQPGRGGVLFADQIVAGQATRGVHRSHDGRVVFAHGRRVFAIAADDPGQQLQPLGQLPESVTALESVPGMLIAGTADGRLFGHRGDGEWRSLPYRSNGPVFGILASGDDNGLSFAVGAREAAVQILDREGHLVGEYRSRYPIRWVATARQGVLGVDRLGQHLQLWRWRDHRAPQLRLRVPDQIHSLAVEPERGGEQT